MVIKELLKTHKLSQHKLARALDIHDSSMSRKLSSDAAWELDQARIAARFFSEELGREVTVVELFPPSPDTPKPAGDPA